MNRFYACLIIITILLIGIFFTQNISFTQIKKIQTFHSKKLTLPRERVVRTDKYSSIRAQLRFGNDLNLEEHNFVEKRTIKVKNSLEKLLEISLEDRNVPRISLICSGGGCRAMLGTFGALSGLKKIGLLDGVMYISSLSGSTWALGLWMSTHMTLKQIKKYIAQRLTHNIYHMSPKEASLMGNMLTVKIGFKQPCTAVDLFGSFLTNNFLHYFGDNRYMVHLSDQAERIKNGDLPCPIYTAVDGRARKIGIAPWYEFTPFEIGSADYAVYVPSWAYGRYFNNGVSINYAPEQSLGFHFGVFGSAFSIHAGYIWKINERKIKDSIIKSYLDRAFQNKRLANARIFWAEIPNFMFGLKDNELNNNKQLKLIDAGIECNLPYLPVSGEREERTQDVLIFFDFSKSMIPSDFQKVEEYARARGLKFPIIDYTNVEKRTISIFKDESDFSVPVVIYMPRISDVQLLQEKKEESQYKKYSRINNFDFEKCRKSFCDTSNFTYTLNQSQQVMDQMEFNVIVNKEKIINAIRWVVERE